MGAELKVESGRGIGSVFHFTLELPLASENTDTAGGESLLFPFRPLKVLVVDDTETNRRLVERLLSKRGHTVICANGAAEAWSALEKEDVDIILLDLCMPETDGFEFFSKFIAEGNSVPVIAVTAKAVDGENEHCAACGMNGYLAKPFTEDQLLAVIRQAVTVGTDIDSMSENACKAREVLLRRYAGEPDIVNEVMQVFWEEYPRLIDRIVTADGAGDMKALAIHAHAYKSAALTAGFENLAGLAGELEHSARRDECEKAKTLTEMIVRGGGL